MARKSSTPSRKASRAAKAKPKDKGKPKDNLPTTPCPICGKACHWKKDFWYNIQGVWDEANKPKSNGKDGKDKTPANTQQQANKDKKSAKCWNCNGTGHFSKDCPKKKRSLSAVDIEWFLLECFRGRGRAEQLRIQGRGRLGDWHRQWCCEIGGSSWRDSWLPRREGQGNWSCVHVCHRRARVLSGETADPGNCGRQSARLEHASRASQEERHERVRHRVVFDFDSNKRDLSHAENKLNGERTYFKLRNRVWELEVKIMPKAETEDILRKMQEQRVEELCPFEAQVCVVPMRGVATSEWTPVVDLRGRPRPP